MERFTKRSKDMDPKLEAFAYPTLDLKIARFIELHVNSKTNTITFTPERFKELTEYVGRKTLIRYYNLKPLQDADVIKFVWTNNDGRRVYMMNPEWSSQFKDADQEKYTDLYNRFVDGDSMGNIRIKYGNVDTEDELGDTGENEGEEESKKSINEEEEPKGDSKEIVIHPEAETIRDSRLEKLKSLAYDTDHKDNPNTAQIRKAKGEFYSRTKKDLGSFVNMEYAVVKGIVVGRCGGQVEMPDVLAYDEKENKTYLQISGN